MNNNAFRVVKAVILAEEIANELPQYRHHPDCPRGKIIQEGQCICGADKNNERIEKIRNLLDIQFRIDFASD